MHLSLPRAMLDRGKDWVSSTAVQPGARWRGSTHHSGPERGTGGRHLFIQLPRSEQQAVGPLGHIGIICCLKLEAEGTAAALDVPLDDVHFVR